MKQEQPSIILITVDCLRADHVGFMGYQRPTTPFLDSLAGESLVFRRAIVAGAPTYYSIPAIMASRYPLALGRDVLGLAPDEPSLATELKKSGYATGAFSAANPYISSRFGYDGGFDVFRDYLESDSAPRAQSAVTGLGVRISRLNRTIQQVRPILGPVCAAYDELYFRYCQRITPVPDSLDKLRRFPAADVIVDQACGWLGSVHDQQFFLWLHFMDPHSPYYPKTDALAELGERAVSPYEARYANSFWNRSDLGAERLARRRDEVLALYDAGIRWVDKQVARLVSTLQSFNLWAGCILAVTADHGEEFLEHAGRYHAPSRLTEELIHVPLLLRVPGSAKKSTSSAPFSLLDLAPTLLNAAGIDIPASFVGSSAWKHAETVEDFGSVAVSECVAGCTNPFHPENRMGPRVLSVTDARFKLVFFFGTSSDLLYDLEADPGEQSPLPAHAQKPVRRRLLEIAREHLRCSEHRDPTLRLQARLRELQLEWGNPTQKLVAVTS